MMVLMDGNRLCTRMAMIPRMTMRMRTADDVRLRAVAALTAISTRPPTKGPTITEARDPVASEGFESRLARQTTAQMIATRPSKPSMGRPASNMSADVCAWISVEPRAPPKR
jgi:hypothetical protein